MADRTDFYFRRKVTEAKLDLAFELIEKADRNLAADIGVYGIVSRAEPTPHAPVPDLTVDLTAPARAYDHLGQRIFFGTGQTVDCSVDHAGVPTEVPTPSNERLGAPQHSPRGAHCTPPSSSRAAVDCLRRREAGGHAALPAAPRTRCGAENTMRRRVLVFVIPREQALGGPPEPDREITVEAPHATPADGSPLRQAGAGARVRSPARHRRRWLVIDAILRPNP